MVKTTTKQLGSAYAWAAADLFQRHGHVSPRMIGQLFRQEHGLEHRTQRINGQFRSWIEFANDADYTIFLLRFA